MKTIKVLPYLILISLVNFSCDSDNSFEVKKRAAKELLSKDCNFISNSSTEFIKRKHPVIGEIVAAVVSNKCDCIIDTLSVQFANDYTLEAIKKMQAQPIETIQQAIEKTIDKKSEAVRKCITTL